MDPDINEKSASINNCVQIKQEIELSMQDLNRQLKDINEKGVEMNTQY